MLGFSVQTIGNLQEPIFKEVSPTGVGTPSIWITSTIRFQLTQLS
ncbi:hypothetical protein SAG0336_08980 [Streptococcus agalactiae GB00653]|nr:hypothetical protein SAG0336_08980 [Streptococcus agalactiae GB00653]